MTAVQQETLQAVANAPTYCVPDARLRRTCQSLAKKGLLRPQCFLNLKARCGDQKAIFVGYYITPKGRAALETSQAPAELEKSS
jgi:hypothetical protein